MAEQVNQQENIASNVESDAEKLAQAVKPETPAVDVPEEDPRPPRPFLYRFRGLILAIVAIVLFFH